MKKAVFALARSSQGQQSRPRQSQPPVNRTVSNIWFLVFPVLFLLLLGFSPAPVQAKYSGGAGTAEEPYKIADYNDLYALADDTNDYNKCFILTTDIDLNPALSGRRQLTKALIAPDMPNSSQYFYGVPFTGTFDGNDYNIINLTIDTNGIGNDFLGLFGQIDTNAILLNLGIEDVNIAGRPSSGYTIGSLYLGGLVGCNNEGSVTNCYATGTVTGDWHVGGLAGVNHGSVTNCYAAGAVTGGRNVGGLVGYNGYYGSLTNCYATSAVTGNSNIGGLVGGYSHGSITNCYATGAVTGNYSIGGLIGSNNGGSVTNCYATGAVTGGGNSAGGLVGENFIGIVTNSLWDVETSGIATSYGGMGLTTFQMQQAVYFQVNNWGGTVWTIDEGNDYPHLAWENAGGEFIVDTDPEVTLSGYGTAEEPWVIESLDDLNLICTGSFFWDKHYILNSDIDLTGATYSWGLIGYDSWHQFTGSFDGDDHIISHLTIEGENYLGLFGYIGPGGFVSNLGLEDVNITSNYYSRNSGGLAGGNAGSVVNCYATGKVSGTSIIGGLLGGNESNMVNCHATVVVTGHVDSKGVGGLVGVSIGNVTNCYATGAVDGVDYVGGLVGYNSYSSVTNCYATGAVTGVDYVGGLVGGDYDANGVFVSSYFLDPNDGGGPDNGIGEPLTDIEMKQQASFVDWDFNAIWSICETMNYPKLTWQIPLADMLCPDGVTFIDYSYFAGHWLWTDYGDVNGLELSGNGRIENADFALFADWWGQTSCGDCGGADYNGDNAVDSGDLQILFDNWLATDYGDCEGAELTGDGFVGIDDALAFSEQWLQGF